MRYIQDHDRYQETMFPHVMDDYITEDNPVRFIDDYLEEIEKNDKAEKDISKQTVKELKEKIESLKSRKQTLEGHENQLEETGKKQIVLTDPDSRIMRTGRNGQDVC